MAQDPKPPRRRLKAHAFGARLLDLDASAAARVHLASEIGDYSDAAV